MQESKEFLAWIEAQKKKQVEVKKAPVKKAAPVKQTVANDDLYDPSTVEIVRSSDYTIVIEHCQNCDQHAWNTRHDEKKYESYANFL